MRMSRLSPFTRFVQALRATIATFPDKRTGKNKRYSLVDAALGAFAVFFTQSPSFPRQTRFKCCENQGVAPGRECSTRPVCV